MWASLAQIKVYLDNFIRVVQGGPTERNQMTRHLFCSIYKSFFPNINRYRAQEEPIYINK